MHNQHPSPVHEEIKHFMFDLLGKPGIQRSAAWNWLPNGRFLLRLRVNHRVIRHIILSDPLSHKGLTTQELHRWWYPCLLVFLCQNAWYPSRTKLVHFQSFLQYNTIRCFSYTNSVRQLSNDLSTVPLYDILHRIHLTRDDKCLPTRSGIFFCWVCRLRHFYTSEWQTEGFPVVSDSIFIVSTCDLPKVAHSLMIVRCSSTLNSVILKSTFECCWNSANQVRTATTLTSIILENDVKVMHF